MELDYIILSRSVLGNLPQYTSWQMMTCGLFYSLTDDQPSLAKLPINFNSALTHQQLEVLHEYSLVLDQFPTDILLLLGTTLENEIHLTPHLV